MFLGPQLIRLRPAEHARARILSYNLGVHALRRDREGEIHVVEPEGRWQYDPHGNRVVRVTFPALAKVHDLRVEVDLAVEVRPVNPFDFFVDDRCRELPLTYPDGLPHELAPFLSSAPPGPELTRFLEDIPPRGYITDHLVAMNQKVATEVRYIIRNEPGLQTSEETLAIKSGSCRDSAVLLTDALRAQGFAARFVSGYLVQLTDEGNIPDMAKGVAEDVVDLHAWCEVYVPGAGWIGLDGTSGLFAGEGHIPLACTGTPALAAPIEFTASGSSTGFSFSMSVARLGHEPRPRAPYTEDTWAAIKGAGRTIDAALRDLAVPLTMGGEPTFVSREHAREPEWNDEALGPTKWSHGLRLARELHRRLAPGGVVIRSSGKHYPGESLPRWALDLVWRRDGEALWRDPGLLALDATDGTADATPPVEVAEAFTERLAEALGVDPTSRMPAYEDPWIAIVHEMNLPDDVDPLAADLDDPEARRTLARILGRGLGQPVGFALPIARVGQGWTSQRWTFRRKHLFLLFGDSAMGLRLPLDRIGGTPLGVIEPDATGARARVQMQTASTPPAPTHELALPDDASVRTALCVEPRDGALHVFLPPVPSLDDFAWLLRAVEEVASGMQQPVRLEGYGPPRDVRIDKAAVTPDPGVIEVNLPVSDSFDAYVGLQELLADAARYAGLTSEKYQLDGREVGTGGGHHLTLGGPTTIESPFLTRPALLSSFLRYFQNHPSLSFFFTGLFVGPTSQAPRVDEARDDALAELEIALARAERADEPMPWLTDRLFRNLLVDLTGNTHRTEISIDKLYDPWTTTGRQGIVELRAFEMPPHERMACAQMLLVRGIVTRLARDAYRQPVIRWCTELHDRFMLPHYLWADLREVVRDLDAHGVPIALEWMRPFLEQRFPVLGTLEREDVTLELRVALEPWHVLGETPTPFGTSRYVDSSLERVQVRVEGVTEGRHQVMVNGYALPLRATGKRSERVAGVRFRAWQPPHCLHPEIGIHHPLRFDVVDTWAKRSLGAATHHVWHPEGRAFEEPPLTAFEAAARRAQRFSVDGHAPYPAEPIPTEAHPDQPFTLDLRRVSDGRRMPAAE